MRTGSTRGYALALLAPTVSSFSYGFLSTSWRKALRNGSWNCISSTEKALYRCAVCLARTRGFIVNRALVTKILNIMRCFSEDIRSLITAAGKKRARIMNGYGSQRRIFRWAPQVKEWLRDAQYVFYLGVIQQS